MRRSFLFLAVALAPVAIAACSDSNSLFGDASVSMQDQCDSASFNAALGPGTCVRQGSVTLAQFNTELAANHSVAAWQFAPTELTLHLGQSIQATNNGGESHTFTEVAQFGGGMVPALNAASGNPIEAPECAALATNTLIPAGGVFTTSPETESGTEYYQCCIHPWMRTTVNVTVF
jgi:plastocyanin